MEPNNRPLFPGIILIVLGVLFLIANITDFRIGELWPLALLLPGIYFYVVFLRDRKNYGVLMPGTVLTVMGLLFFYVQYQGWEEMARVWPFFLIGPGLGFLLMYLLGPREKGFLIPGSILIILGVAFLGAAFDNEYFWPLILIALGILVLLRPRTTGVETPQVPEPPPRQ